MGFPIALGTKSAASRPIPAAQPIEEFDPRDGGLLLPSRPSTPCLVVATSADQELLALITLYYYNMCRKDDGRVAYSVAELHIQISLLGQSTSLSGRDGLHRIPLLGSIKDGDSQDESVYKQDYTIKPMATFSADRRYLTCLIPHPPSFTESSSSVIVFQLRRPKGKDSNAASNSGGRPPLPAYIVPSILEKPVVPVATNPIVLLSSSDEKLPLSNATSICDIETAVGPLVSGLLLVGCRDGSVQVATYRPAVCCGELHSSEMGDNHTDAPAVVELDHWTEWRDPNERTFVGRLAVVWSNGRVRVFRSHFAETDETDHVDSTDDRHAVSSSIRSSSSKGTIRQEASDFSFGVMPTHEFPNLGHDDYDHWNSNPTRKIVALKWIAGSYLAVLEAPDEQCSVHVVGLYDYGKCAPVSTMSVAREQLDESVEGIFQTQSTPRVSQDDVHAHGDDDVHERLSLEYDAHTDCLAITSFLQEKDVDYYKRRFICLWSWRTNVLGLLAPLSYGPTLDSIECGTIYFAIDHVKRRKVVLVGASSVNSAQHQICLYKETFDIAVLSPPYENVLQRFKLRETNALLLSAESVSFPNCTKTSPAMEHFEIEWTEAAIPRPYLSSFGAPTLAAMGKELGRSVAVASVRGFCVLDRTGSDRPSSRTPDDETNASISQHATTHDDTMTKLLLRGGSGSSRWRVFANETHERAFRVIAMTWWEGFVIQTSRSVEAHAYTDDLLITIIEVLESQDKCQGYYLSCWSGRDVELSSQLLRLGTSTNGGGKGTRWGIPLPPDFLAVSIDLLACPFVEQGSRIATILLADSTYLTNYYVFQLQVSTQAKESSSFSVMGLCIANGNVGSPSELFLASASFSMAFRDYEWEKSEDFAVLGVIRKYGGGLDAVSVCSSNIVIVGQVIESADHGDDEPRSAEISRYWLADIVLDQRRLFVWTFQLACGRLVSWSVPFLESMDELNLSSNVQGRIHPSTASSMVHPKSSILGFVCPSGTVSNWMQQSTLGAQCDFLCGSVPRSPRGYVVGVSQSVKNIQTSLAADAFDGNFLSSVLDHVVLAPSDFKLYPPAFLPSLYILAIEADSYSFSSSDGCDRFERVFQQKMKSRALQDMSVLSIQLIILRLVEKLSVISKTSESTGSQKYSRLRGILVTVVSGIRREMTALQFASFFLQLGRQVEPSCLPHLFPLPETVEDLASIAVACGSILISVSAIPLLLDQKTTLSMCTSLFHYCLNRFDASFGAMSTYNQFVICPEEFEATGGLFRYALKGQHRRPEVHRVLEHDEAVDIDEVAPTSRYSIMCGLPDIFKSSRVRTPPPTFAADTLDESPLLVHGITDERIQKLKDFGVNHIRRLSLWKDLHSSNTCLGNVPSVASRFVVASLFGGSAYETRIGWNKVAALANILMRDVVQPECSSGSLARALQHSKVNRWVALVPVDIRRGGMTQVVEYCLEQCCLDAEPAVRVLDFLLVLLLKCDMRYLGSDRPGLLLATVVAAHVAERIPEILDSPSNSMDELSAAYFELFPINSGSSKDVDRIIIV